MVQELAQKIVRRAAALSAALLVALVGLIVYYIGGERILQLLYSSKALRADLNLPLVIGYDRVAYYLKFLYPALCFFVALVAFWNGSGNEGRRLWPYLTLALIIGPLTFINYRLSDQWLNVGAQAILNIFIIFVSLTLVLRLRERRSRAADAVSFQILAILFVTVVGIALPLFYTAIFLGVFLGLLDHDQVQQIDEQVPLAFAAGVGAVGTLIAQLEGLRGSRGTHKRSST